MVGKTMAIAAQLTCHTCWRPFGSPNSSKPTTVARKRGMKHPKFIVLIYISQYIASAMMTDSHNFPAQR